jgi:Tfp pilus assembly protein PilX
MWMNTMEKKCLLNNEDGSVVAISVVILAFLTVIGIAATTTTSIELQIAGNNKVYKENFYLAEGAAMVLAQILENQADLKAREFPDPGGGDDVDIAGKDEVEDEEITKDTYWEGDEDKSCEATGLVTNDPPRIIAKSEGLAMGSSLDMSGGSRIYEYTIFGRRKKNNCAVVIEVGYKKRF